MAGWITLFDIRCKLLNAGVEPDGIIATLSWAVRRRGLVSSAFYHMLVSRGKDSSECEQLMPDDIMRTEIHDGLWRALPRVDRSPHVIAEIDWQGNRISLECVSQEQSEWPYMMAIYRSVAFDAVAAAALIEELARETAGGESLHEHRLAWIREHGTNSNVKLSWQQFKAQFPTASCGISRVFAVEYNDIFKRKQGRPKKTINPQ